MSETQTRVAMLLSLTSFEAFYGGVMKLSCKQYLDSYRNDFSYIYAQALANLRTEVTIYIPAWTCKGIHKIEECISVRFLPIARWYRIWTACPFLSKTLVGRYISECANTRAFEDAFRQALAEDRITSLYIQEYWTARFDYIVRKIGIPIIGSDHGGRRQRQLTFLKRRSFQLAAAITCQSEEECAEVRAFGREPVLLPNGVDTGFYSPPVISRRTQSILIVSRLTDNQKRISDLIRAMQFLPEPWKLQIAGTGPDALILRNLAVNLGVADRIEFLGFVTDKSRLRDLYRDCGVYSMPSSREAACLAVLEAMSCGCAVVLTRIRTFEAMVENGTTGCLVPVGAPEQLAEAVLNAWAASARMGQAARRAVEERYSLDAMAKRLSDLLSTGTLNQIG